ncbi:Ig-like domain-containing protein [Methanimicrococcus blatticola]|uniref:Ig-like domain-containing protein n=1 Tax=Methanimicrococcus blatticola TaxID=91560 RepID=UPI00105F33EA|nr:Ig-like domain-containing protein [Methanimicrococcus blatticola]MCC2508458.1 Ig-like domain-containing protein [Methanimicrococcus blatticola]
MILITLLLLSAVVPQAAFADLPDNSGGSSFTSAAYGKNWDGVDFESMIGNGVYYGTYDHITTINYNTGSHVRENEETPILWRVMGEEESDGRLTMMSEYILDGKRYSHRNVDGLYTFDQGFSNFAVSNLRYWLNYYTYSSTYSQYGNVVNGFLYSFGDDSTAAEYNSLAEGIVVTRLFDRITGVEYTDPSTYPNNWKPGMYYTANFPYSLNTRVYLPWGHSGGDSTTYISGAGSVAFPHANSGKLYWDAAQSNKDDYLIGVANTDALIGTTKNGINVSYWVGSPNAYSNADLMENDNSLPLYVRTSRNGSIGVGPGSVLPNMTVGVRPIVKLIPENVIFAHEVSETATRPDQVQADKGAAGIWNYSTHDGSGTNYKLTIINSSLELKELYNGSTSLTNNTFLPLTSGGTITLNSSDFDGTYLAYKIVYDDGTTRSIVSYGNSKTESDKSILEIKMANNIANTNGFSGSGDYTLYVWSQQEVSDIRSFEGSPTWYFPLGIGETPSSLGPEVESATPTGIDVSVTTNTASITFNSEMDASVGFPGTVKLDNGATLTGGTWSNENKTITYSLSGLDYSTTYTFDIKDFEGTFGNAMVTPHKLLEFTTQSAPPNVITVTPTGTGIPITADTVSITFDKDMDTDVIGSVTLDNSAVLSNGAWVDSRTITYDLSNLAYSTTYTYTITGFTDTDGNLMVTPSPDFSFTTQSAPPNVTAVTPNGTGIPIATNSVSITFDKDMDTGTVGSVFLNNGAELGTVGTWSPDSRTITYSLANLTYSTTYTYTITGFKDTDGNLMVTPSPAFTFTTEPDTHHPYVTAVNPEGTGIAIGTNKASITFNEAMKATPGNVVLNDGATLTGGTWSNGQKTITYDLSGLNYSTTYTYTITGFQDLAGNLMITPDPAFTFTTEPDTHYPIVEAVTPNGTGVLISTNKASITFNEPMKNGLGTVVLDKGAGLANGVWSADQKTITYDLSNLDYSTIYTFTISDFEDTAGNVMATPPTVFNFETEPDLIPPNAISATPNGTGISITASSASITFDKKMDTTVAGTVTLDNGALLNLAGGTWSNDDKTITYSLSNLTYSTTYTYSISGFKDTAGNNMVTPHADFNFTTEPDTTKPIAISAVPSGTNIAITTDSASISFNKKMNTTHPGTVTLNNGATLSGGTWSSDGKTITYALSGLTYSKTYTFDIKDFKDTAGNTMVTPHAVFNFTTAADTNQPIAVSASPNGTTVAVSTNTASITFNKKMNASASFPGTVTLDNGATLTGGTWSNENKTITYTLSGLTYSTTYTFDIKDFEDTFGNVMVTPHAVFNFTTEANSVAPNVIRVTPNGTGVAIDTNSASITFDVEMNTGVTGTVTLDNGAVLSNGVWTDSRTVTYDLSNLAHSTTYTYTIAGFKGSNNVLMNTPIPDFTFKTVDAGNKGGGGDGGGTIVIPESPDQPDNGDNTDGTSGSDDDNMGGYEDDVQPLFVILLFVIALAVFAYRRAEEENDAQDETFMGRFNPL